VDGLRHALHQPAEFSAAADAGAVLGATLGAFLITSLLFDPEQRFLSSRPRRSG
jgi:hypothetical protein